MSSIKVGFNDIREMAPYLKQFPVMLRGPHGIGKSSFVWALADEWKMPVVTRRLSQMSDGDTLGIPHAVRAKAVRHGRTFKMVLDPEGDLMTQFAPPDWLIMASQHPVVLFFDEVDRADKSVRQSIMEITDSRRIAGVDLHPETVIVAASNSGEEDKFADYITEQLDPAEFDRWTVFDVLISKDEWIRWARSAGVHWSIIEFISKTAGVAGAQGALYPLMTEENEPNVVSPSPRSWHRLSQAAFELFDKACRTPSRERGPLAGKIKMISQGFIGSKTSADFARFLLEIETSISAEDILNGNVEIDFAMANMGKSSKMNVNEAFANEWIFRAMTAEQISRMVAYILHLDDGLCNAMLKGMTEVDTLNMTPEQVKIWKGNLTMMGRGFPLESWLENRERPDDRFINGNLVVPVNENGEQISIAGKLGLLQKFKAASKTK